MMIEPLPIADKQEKRCAAVYDVMLLPITNPIADNQPISYDYDVMLAVKFIF